MKFEKYEACGNDFILLDGIIEEVKINTAQIKKICDRHFGIGADGLIIIEACNEANFYMNFYNSDGTKAMMCGNGARASALFAYQRGYLSNNNPNFLAGDKIYGINISDYEKTGDIEIFIDGDNKYEEYDDGYFLNTGVPHFVKIVNDFDFDLKEEGKKLSNDERFMPERTNVDFIIIDGDCVKIRTFERGVEDITLACGTGAIAAAIVASKQNTNSSYISNDFQIISEGGKISISFDGDLDNYYSKIKLRGPVNKIFKGDTKI